ncbi:MAG: MFS transporter [Planctomycetaceae bacterium]|nr:MFS transporter [Planctomycetaceae bacterium]
MTSSTMVSPDEEPIYTRKFWLAFLANVMLVTANTLTFRFAEFVKFLGGTEETTGFIVSVGLIGSLFWRAFLGPALDNFGIRRVWLLSTLVYMLGCFTILTTGEIGIQIYVGRILFALGLASMFASSVAHIQGQAPPNRRTEIIGTFGASGFLGMICGSQLGDFIFQVFPQSNLLYRILFGLTLALGATHAMVAALLTQGDRHDRPSESPPVYKLLVRYFPPKVFIVTAMMGLGFSVTMIFLTRYATELGLSGIRTFFTSYAITAFSMRIVARNWSRAVGRHQLIVYGLAGHALGQVALTFVTSEWHLILPAICCGFGHALLFPCVVSLGAGSFPIQYRGTGTTITLAAVDLGTTLTAPLLGWVIDTSGFHAMLFTVSGVLACSTVFYAFLTWQIVDDDVSPAEHRIRRPEPGKAVVAPVAGNSNGA